MVTAEDIQKLYIAYFGRPADPAGLTFYLAKVNRALGGDFAPILPEFFDSAEYKSLYNFDISAASGRQAAVTAVYQNLLNRVPDSQGLSFYSGLLEKDQAGGLSRLVLDVLNGVRGTDVDTINAKVLAASTFTQNLGTDVNGNGSTADEATAYQGDAAVLLAREFLSKIDGNTLFSIQQGQDPITDAANEAIKSLLASRTTFTVEVDDIKTNDTFLSSSLTFVNGAVLKDSTLNSGDSVDMSGFNSAVGDLSDTVQIFVSGNRLTANPTFDLKIKGVENLAVTNTESDNLRNVQFNINDLDGALAKIIMPSLRVGDGFESTTTFSGLSQLIDLQFDVQRSAGTSVTTAELQSQINAARRTVDLQFAAEAIASTADALTVQITGTNESDALQTALSQPRLSNFALKTNGIEQLFISSEQTIALSTPLAPQLIRQLILEQGSDVKNITVVSSQARDFIVDASAVGSQILTFDATRVNAVNGSTQRVVFDIGSGLNASQVLRGGLSGNDVLVLSSPASLNAATLNAIDGFEVIRLDQSSTQQLNTSGVRGLKATELRGSLSGDRFTLVGVDHETNTGPEVFITRNTSKVEALVASVSTLDLGAIDEVLDVSVGANLASLTLNNSRSVNLTTISPEVQDFIDPLSAVRTVSKLIVDDATTLSVTTPGTVTTGDETIISIGSITTDVLRTIKTGDAFSRLTMTDFVQKQANTGLDILGGNLADSLYGSNQRDSIQGGQGADQINVLDSANDSSLIDRVLYQTKAVSKTVGATVGLEFGDSIVGFNPVNTSGTDTTNEDKLVFTRDFVFGSNSNQAQFGAAGNAGLLGGGLLGNAGETRIKVLTRADFVLDDDDAVVIMSNDVRDFLGLTASDLEGDLSKLKNVVDTKLAPGAANAVPLQDRFLLFVSNDVDTFGYQFVNVAPDAVNNSDPTITTPDGRPDSVNYQNVGQTLGGNEWMLRLVGLNSASVLDFANFELIDGAV